MKQKTMKKFTSSVKTGFHNRGDAMSKKMIMAVIFGFVLGLTRSIFTAGISTFIIWFISTFGYKAWKRIQLGKIVEERCKDECD